MKNSRWIAFAYVGPAVLVMAAACLYPVLSAFQLAGYDWSMGTPWSSARWVGWDNMVSAFSNPRVWSSLFTTLLFAAVCVSAEMVLGIALALALEKPVRGMAVFRTLFILPGGVDDSRLSATGVTAGTYSSMTVDVTGRVTAGTNPGYITANQNITVSGDVTGSGTTSMALTLAASGVTAGTYNNSATAVSPITVDAKGRVTAIGAAVTVTPAWTSVSGKPTTLSGFGITDALSTSATIDGGSF